jgi:uncharacterized protein YjbI with pentapeptide repeats
LLSRGRNGLVQYLKKITSKFEIPLLVGLSIQDREFYSTHVRWRWSLLLKKVERLVRLRKEVTLPIRRPALVLIVGVCTYSLISFAFEVNLGQLVKLLFSEDFVRDKPQALTASLAIIGLPIAFLIWMFRDQNNIWQIENQRKDINLKDFQKLSELVAGLHVPETVVTTTKKESTTEKLSPGQYRERTDLKETSKTTATSESPDSSPQETNRREGAIALQIAAVFQLQAFLRGEYGHNFKRPAFQLLKSMWTAVLMRRTPDFDNLAATHEFDYSPASIIKKRENIRNSMSSGIGEAIALVLTEHGAEVFRDHCNDLPYSTFAGLDSSLQSRHDRYLSNVFLDDLNLRGCRFDAANLQLAGLQRTNLSSAKLRFADMSMASLQEADLMGAECQFCILSGAHLQGADLRLTNLIFSEVYSANLRDAKLIETTLLNARLDGSDLRGAVLVNIKIGAGATFTNCVFDSSSIIAVGTQAPNQYGLDFPKDYIIDEAASAKLREQLEELGARFV